MKKYYRTLDHVLAALELVVKGNGVEAAKALTQAAKSPDMKEAVAALNEEQAQLYKAETAAKKPAKPNVELEMSQALARLMKDAKAVTAADDDQDDDQDQDDQDQQETAAEDDKDDQDDDKDQDQQETAAEDDDQEIDIDLDDERDDDQDKEQVQSSVSARLARAERNRAKRS